MDEKIKKFSEDIAAFCSTLPNFPFWPKEFTEKDKKEFVANTLRKGNSLIRKYSEEEISDRLRLLGYI